jgi:hypothetical protein
MSAYITRAQVTNLVPALVLNDALDDNGDGAEDAGLFDSLAQTQSLIVDGFLSGLFPTPFANPPAKAQIATLFFVLEALYQRRGTPLEKNPFSAQATWWRVHLQRVGNRELPFDAGTPKAYAPGAITEELSALKGSSL